jgi:hypothetical protein
LKTLSYAAEAIKSDFDPPSWIDPPFLANLTKDVLESHRWSKLKLMHGYAILFSVAILNMTKNFSI